jgi:hypothetical protein
MLRLDYFLAMAFRTKASYPLAFTAALRATNPHDTDDRFTRELLTSSERL